MAAGGDVTGFIFISQSGMNEFTRLTCSVALCDSATPGGRALPAACAVAVVMAAKGPGARGQGRVQEGRGPGSDPAGPRAPRAQAKHPVELPWNAQHLVRGAMPPSGLMSQCIGLAFCSFYSNKRYYNRVAVICFVGTPSCFFIELSHLSRTR